MRLVPGSASIGDVTCVACGENHQLVFIRLPEPQVDDKGIVWPFRAVCPTNGKAVLMREVRATKVET